jgi:hypothetical protein
LFSNCGLPKRTEKIEERQDVTGEYIFWGNKKTLEVTKKGTKPKGKKAKTCFFFLCYGKELK